MVAAVDQSNTPVAADMRAYYNQSFVELGNTEAHRNMPSQCTKLSYHVYAAELSFATLILQPRGYICDDAAFSRIIVQISIENCSRSFERVNDRCVCERRLMRFLNNDTACDLKTASLRKKGSLWLQYGKSYLKVHVNCPLGYCNIKAAYISFEDPDKQCTSHRSGVICGACSTNYSLALGSSRCLPCTAHYSYVWLIIMFAMMGVALVALLLVCNITVSSGTLNGIIFYANVVSVSGLTSAQSCSLHPMLTIFIAWVNLDFGVETCFFVGMDTYQKTWLQLVFPLYIWLLVLAAIVASHYSSTVMKVLGRNNIAILATLFLLSYSKLLKTIIAHSWLLPSLLGRHQASLISMATPFHLFL